MKKFRDIQAVEEWLEPMDYPGFWYAVEPYSLNLQDREDCDQQLREGGVPVDTMLEVLKGFARIELTQKFGLKHRDPAPWLKEVGAH